MKRTSIFFILLVALSYGVAANPDFTGIAIHEWVSVLLIAVIVFHLGTHMDWVLKALRKIKKTVSTGHLILDIVLLLLFAVVTVSGLAVSRFVMPLLNLTSMGYFFWSPIHAISAKLLLAGVIVHLVVHYKWFFGLARKFRSKKMTEQREEKLDSADE